jgi:hypothetical protein
MFELGYSKIIRPDGEKTYVGTFLVRNNKIKDTSKNPIAIH